MSNFRLTGISTVQEKLAERREIIIEKMKKQKYGSVLSLASMCTVTFLLKRQDYDYYNITPYTRDVTEKLHLAGYVNASFIMTPSKRYFAAQMPKPEYCDLFRDFIIKSDAELVVCLIACAEYDYFHDSELVERTEVPFSPQSNKEDAATFFYDEVYDIGRKIRRLRFCSWTDHASPDEKNFVCFYNHFTQIMCKNVIVHCHAGVGRTGTFIMYDMASKEEDITVESFVDILLYLRSCRPYLVYKEEQLRFLAHSFLHKSMIKTKAHPSPKTNKHSQP
jgi:protein tyrosine phosphatase